MFLNPHHFTQQQNRGILLSTSPMPFGQVGDGRLRFLQKKVFRQVTYHLTAGAWRGKRERCDIDRATPLRQRPRRRNDARLVPKGKMQRGAVIGRFVPSTFFPASPAVVTLTTGRQQVLPPGAGNARRARKHRAVELRSPIFGLLIFFANRAIFLNLLLQLLWRMQPLE